MHIDDHLVDEENYNENQTEKTSNVSEKRRDVIYQLFMVYINVVREKENSAALVCRNFVIIYWTKLDICVLTRRLTKLFLIFPIFLEKLIRSGLCVLSFTYFPLITNPGNGAVQRGFQEMSK